MLYKLWRSILKEIQLLSRDLGGLAVLFIMPLVLVVMVTAIQYQTLDNTDHQLPVLWIDHDHDSISNELYKGLMKTEAFELVSEIEAEKIEEKQAKNLVNEGKYQMAIIVPQGLTKVLYENVERNVEEIVGEFSLDSIQTETKNHTKAKEIELIFDPAVQENMRNSLKFGIEKIIYQAQSKAIYQAFEEVMGGRSGNLFANEPLIQYKESSTAPQELQPNAVQHNVPAWTLFAIFFIIVPLSINIVKEKNLGTNYRLLTSPMPYFILLMGKMLVYLLVCLLQFFAVLLVAKLVFPLIGLPNFELHGQLGLMVLMTFCASLAAIGLGILLGTISKTQEQAPPFGATLVVILAAIGGVWVPVFMMSKTFQCLAELSPMRWALSGYYDIILRNGGLSLILPEIISLFLFFSLCLGIAIIYDRKKRTA
ncbi:ABC transporter permease [Vaginella massiliensis]|uniref:ABC transporter permease n=1 Tax=Vaginella massiliensis TaxID=1816680 RepID=UPI0008382EDD|nr:ABC transporter permease [Vaginella massiliensis]